MTDFHGQELEFSSQDSQDRLQRLQAIHDLLEKLGSSAIGFIETQRHYGHGIEFGGGIMGPPIGPAPYESLEAMIADGQKAGKEQAEQMKKW